MNRIKRMIAFGCTSLLMVSGASVADTAYERALGIGSQNNNSLYYNATGNKIEVYPGIWAEKPISSDSRNKEEIYPGVWRDKNNNVDNNSVTYNGSNSTLEYTVNNGSTQRSSGRRSSSSTQGLNIKDQPRNESNSSNTNNQSNSSRSNARSSISIGTSAGGGVVERPRERPANINLPSVESLIMD